MKKNKYILLACLADISGNPRPFKMLKYFNQNGYNIDLLSFANRTDISGLYIDHYIIHNSGKLYDKYLQKLYRSLYYLPLIKEIRYWAVRKSIGAEIDAIDIDKYSHILVEDFEFLIILKEQLQKIIIDLREYYPSQYEHKLTFRIYGKPFRKWVLRNFLSKINNAYTVSKGLQEKYLHEFQRKTILVRSIPYYEDLSPTEVDCNKIKIVHHGVANPNRKLGILITLMKMLDKRFTLDLYLLGDQNEISRLTRLENDSNLNISIKKPIPFNLIIKKLNSYDLGIFYIEPTTFNLKHSLPNKFFEFIMARLGVIVSPIVDMAELIDEYNVGLYPEKFDLVELACLLNKLTVDDINKFKIASHKASRMLCFEKEVQELGTIFV